MMSRPQGANRAEALRVTVTTRRVLGVLLAVYLALLAVALLAPTSTDQDSMVHWLMRQLVHGGVSPGVVRYSRMEWVMNAAIIAPVSLLGSLLWPRWTWRDWTAAGFVTFGAVELIQWLFLPRRDGSFSDVVANTIGALVGAVLAIALKWLARRFRTRG